MLNPILAIPFILTPLVTGTIGYFATALGFAAKAVVMVPWPMRRRSSMLIWPQQEISVQLLRNLFVLLFLF